MGRVISNVRASAVDAPRLLGSGSMPIWDKATTPRGFSESWVPRPLGFQGAVARQRRLIESYENECSLTTSECQRTRCPPRTERRQRHVLRSIGEQRVLKRGLLKLELLLQNQCDPQLLLRFPRRASGGPVMLSESFFQRLIAGEVEFRSLMGADVAGAQHDLRHLTIAQLLTIRNRCLDFATVSSSHESHRNFLETVDKFLFELVAKIDLRGPFPQSLGPAHKLGKRLALILGAGAELPSLSELHSPFWAIPLDSDEWGSCCEVAIFNKAELWVRACSSDPVELSDVLGKDHVNVIWEGSVGQGNLRELYWEVSPVDPMREDLIQEMNKSPHGCADPRLLQGELSRALFLRGMVDGPEGVKTTIAAATRNQRARSGPQRPTCWSPPSVGIGNDPCGDGEKPGRRRHSDILPRPASFSSSSSEECLPAGKDEIQEVFDFKVPETFLLDAEGPAEAVCDDCFDTQTEDYSCPQFNVQDDYVPTLHDFHRSDRRDCTQCCGWRSRDVPQFQMVGLGHDAHEQKEGFWTWQRFLPSMVMSCMIR